MFGGLGWPELLVILAILLLVFGAAKLPKLSRSAGESISEFKKGLSLNDEDKKDKKGKSDKA